MPELPETAIFARDMHKELAGKTIGGFLVLQPKCLNLPQAEFQAAQGWLLLNLGMGGEILLTDRAHLPEKYRQIVDFSDGACLAINF